MNSPSTNLAWHYPSGPQAGTASKTQQQKQPSQQQQTRSAFNTVTNQYDTSSDLEFPRAASSGSTQRPALQRYPSHISTNDADLLLNLHAPYTSQPTTDSPSFPDFTTNQVPDGSLAADPHQTSFNNLASANWNYGNLWNPWDLSDAGAGGQVLQPFGDMMIESQDVDMSCLGLDTMPWFDNWGLFDSTANGGGGGTGTGDGPRSGG